MNELNDTVTTILQEDYIRRILIIFIALLIIFWVIYLLKKFITRQITDTRHQYRSRKVINIFGYFLIVSVVLFVYSDKLGNIGVTLGVAGAGIAFALQEVIISIAGWLSIILSNSLKNGHRVKIGNITGDIIDIGVLKSTIMEIGDWVEGDLYNGRITTISNSFVFKEPVQNFSADYPFLWDEIKIPVRIESNSQLARELFMAIANEICGDYAKRSKATWNKIAGKYRIENAEVEPMVTLSFDENWITFTIRYIVDYRRRRSTKDQLFTRILQELGENQKEIMIATSALEITTAPGQEKE